MNQTTAANAADPFNWVRLGKSTSWQRLEENSVGRLAVCIGEHPDVFPVNYVVVDETIAFRTEAGTKLAGSLLGAAVAFEVDQVDEENRVGWSVVAHGKAHEVEKLADLIALEPYDLEPWIGERRRWVTIRVDDISGREIRHDGPDPGTDS